MKLAVKKQILRSVWRYPFFFIPALFVMFAMPRASYALSTHRAGIDSAYIPITPAKLRAEIIANKNNEVQLVQLLRRGYQQNEVAVGYNTLKELSTKEPNNPVVLAAYAFAIQIGRGWFEEDPSLHTKWLANRQWPPSPDVFDQSLNKALKIDPYLWLPYTLKGNILIGNKKTQQQGLELLKKGVEYGPNVSFAHYFLGMGYITYGALFMSYNKSLTQCLKAMSLRPVVADAGINVFWLYEYPLRNRKMAINAKKALLAVLPSEKVLDSSLQKELTKYP